MDFFVPKTLPHYCNVCTSYHILKKILYLPSEAAASATALCVLKFGKNVQLGCLIRDFSSKILKISIKNFPYNIYTCLKGFNALTMTIKSAANKLYVVVG